MCFHVYVAYPTIIFYAVRPGAYVLSMTPSGFRVRAKLNHSGVLGPKELSQPGWEYSYRCWGSLGLGVWYMPRLYIYELCQFLSVSVRCMDVKYVDRACLGNTFRPSALVCKLLPKLSLAPSCRHTLELRRSLYVGDSLITVSDAALGVFDLR